jgi:hypothetical protein
MSSLELPSYVVHLTNKETNKQTDLPCQYHYPKVKILSLATNNQEIKNQLLLDDGCNASKLALETHIVFKSML